MAFGGVGADQEGHAAMVEVLIAAGRAIGAEAAGVSGHGGAHAQPRVGIKIVGT